MCIAVNFKNIQKSQVNIVNLGFTVFFFSFSDMADRILSTLIGGSVARLRILQNLLVTGRIWEL